MAENSNHLILPRDALGQKLNGSRGRPFLCSVVLEPQAARTKKAGSESDGGAGVIWRLLPSHVQHLYGDDPKPVFSYDREPQHRQLASLGALGFSRPVAAF